MSSYLKLMERVRRMTALRDAAEILGWDQQVMMPPAGVEGRAAQLGAISSVSHEILVAPETGRLLAEAEREETSADARAQLREIRFSYDRETRVPMSLVEETSRAAAIGYEAWVEARRKSEFSLFRPHLERILELRRRHAALVAPDAPPYEALFQDYEPWIPLAQARANLRELREGLRPLVARAKTRDAPPPTTFAGDWPEPEQEAMCRRVSKMIGYDFARGRLDRSPHPFSAGGPNDARITTRYARDQPLMALLGTMHEAGHAMYSQGLPLEHAGTPLGDARDLVVHESQSRLWENHVGRSLPFWERALPMMREAFPANLKGVSVHDAWRAVNDVRPTPIRVEADELTYHMHVALRLEIEEALVSGELPVDEVPHRWNELMRRDLGLAPPDDARGCLQDTHWSGGAFGYFPTYSLGSMLSAQLAEAYERQGGSLSDYPALLAWLRAHVHSQGKRWKTGELVERATGAPLSPDAFVQYATRKYEQVLA